jgi:nicotinamidase-related amidase
MTDFQVPPFITDWLASLVSPALADVAADPDTTAVFSADMINGFLRFGALSSGRVNGLTDPVVALFGRAWDAGVREFVLLQDTHDEHTPEFDAYPPHCIAGTEESRTIPELANLPNSERFTVIEKNSLNPAIGTIFDAWLAEHDHLKTAIVVGNCTDLCVYQLAMHIRMRANALNLDGQQVIVPADCVTTFDTPGHPADFFHPVFLQHMSSNGIRIVRTLA